MKIFRFLLVAALFVTASLVLPHLPDQVPTHWNTYGEPDTFSSKEFAAFLVPFMSLGFLVLFPLLAKIDPKKENYPKFKASWEWIQTLLFSMLAYFYGVQLFVTLVPEKQSMLPRLMFIGLALLFIALGNSIGKVRQNFFVGLKTPWTLSDPEVWQKSQRVTGWSFVIGGLIFLVLSILGAIPYLGTIFIAVTIVMVAFPVFYSYFVFRAKNSKK